MTAPNANRAEELTDYPAFFLRGSERSKIERNLKVGIHRERFAKPPTGKATRVRVSALTL
jgi:hypothetical protein